jgi:hypothetical protein
MGRLGDCSTRRCSRLGLALSYLAAFVSKQLRPQDKYRVIAFDDACTALDDWQARGADFDRLDAMDAWAAAIGRVRVGGSRLYTAVAAAVGAQAAVAAAENVLVVLSDGEAMDDDRFETASAAVRSPDCPGFRALLVKIDDSTPPAGGRRQLRNLGERRSWCGLRSGARPDHVVYQLVRVPAAVDLTTAPGRRVNEALGSAFSSLSLATPTASRA